MGKKCEKQQKAHASLIKAGVRQNKTAKQIAAEQGYSLILTARLSFRVEQPRRQMHCTLYSCNVAFAANRKRNM